MIVEHKTATLEALMAEVERLTAEVAQFRQERDDWKGSFETSNEAVAALTAALEGLGQEMRSEAILLAALRTPKAKS